MVLVDTICSVGGKLIYVVDKQRERCPITLTVFYLVCITFLWPRAYTVSLILFILYVLFKFKRLIICYISHILYFDSKPKYVHLITHFSFYLCYRVFTFQVPFCEVIYDFHIKPMFGSSLPAFVCGKARTLFTLFLFVCVNWCPIHIVLFLFYFSYICVPFVASFSELPIFDCPFGILQRLFH